jgi:hypothetical protein
MPRRNTMLALAALVLLAAPAVLFSQGTPAADFVGIWTLDKDALGAEMRRLMKTEMANMSPDEWAELGPSMNAILENMVRRSDETVEIRGDGITLINGHDGKQKASRWEQQGDRARLEPEGDTSLEGPLEGETLPLRAEGEPPSRLYSSAVTTGSTWLWGSFKGVA